MVLYTELWIDSLEVLHYVNTLLVVDDWKWRLLHWRDHQTGCGWLQIGIVTVERRLVVLFSGDIYTDTENIGVVVIVGDCYIKWKETLFDEIW
jgi:hypothetical protein